MKLSKSLVFVGPMLSLLLISCNPDSVRNASKVLSIEYANGTVVVDNPMAPYGVTIQVDGTDVLMNSIYSGKDIVLKVSGLCNDGSLKIYTKKSFMLQMDGLDLTNQDGPAINIQGRKDNYINIPEGAINRLTDGELYDREITVNGIIEKQSAAFFSEGGLFFQGGGSLTVVSRGLYQHAINSDDYVRIDGVHLTVESSKNDGIHTNDGFVQVGGSVDLNVAGDGIDAGTAYVVISGGQLTIKCDSLASDGISCDSVLSVSGGVIDIQVYGNQSKGLKSQNTIRLTGGTLSISAFGGVALNPFGLGFDPSYSTGIKSASNVLVDGANVTINHSGESGKCISVGVDFTLKSGNVTLSTTGDGGLFVNEFGVTDAYSSSCVSSNATIQILGGTLNARSTGIGGKGLSADGELTIGSSTSNPTLIVSASGQSVMMATTSMTEAKVLKSDMNIYIISGTILLDASGLGSAIDSNNGLYISGGLLVAQGPQNNTGVKTVSYETEFSITGGTLMISSPYRLSPTLPTETTSTQNYAFIKPYIANTYVTSNSSITVLDSVSKPLFSYKPKRNAFSFLYSSPSLKQDVAHKLYVGGTISNGTEYNGFYINNDYIPGTLKKSFTPTSINTSVLFIL